jgi:hypothetical protein
MKFVLRIGLLCSVATISLSAQTQSIGGVVTDSTGAALVEVKILAINDSTGVSVSATTNSSGNYQIPNLMTGVYSVTFEHHGFERYKETGVNLDTAEERGLNVVMTVGSTSETMTVVASAATLDDRTSSIAQTFEPQQVADLPLGDRRTMNLINLTAGAVFVNYDSGSKPNFSLAGGRTQSQMLWIDGGSAQNMRLGVGQMDVDPPTETIQEVKVLSNNYSAEYGAANGGVIIETTKSGTNTFHGSAYEFLRNNAFNAPGYFAPILNGSKTIPKLRYNIYGATLGGPVRRNKTFFFFGYEGRQLGIGSTTTLTVPTLLQRNGDFSQTLTAAGAVIPIYDPSTTQTVSGVTRRTAFAGNVIPASQIDPVSLKVLGYYPLPNRPPDSITGNNNFRANSTTWTKSTHYLAKVDHVFREKDRLTGRYLYNADNQNVVGVYPQGDAADPTAYNLAHQQYLFVNEIHIFSATTVNDIRFNYGDRIAHTFTNGVGSKAVTALGLTGVSDNAFPQFLPAGFSNLGSNAQERRQYPIRSLQFVDNLSKIIGKHSIKVGAEARKSSNYETNLSTASGAFTFTTQPTGQPGSAATGSGLATLLVGFPTTFARSQTAVSDRHSWYYGAFFQDDVTVSRYLTLNLGLRWEGDTPMVDANNRMNSFDPAQINPVAGVPGVVKFLGLNGFRNTPWDFDSNNFGPRVGFAWRPHFTEKIVVRGGYGIAFSHPFDTGQPASASLGFGTNINTTTPDNGITAPFYLKDGVPGNLTSPALNDSFGAVAPARTTTTPVTFFDPNRRTGYSQQSNLSVQYQVSGSTIVEVTALSNIGHKLPNSTLSVNQIAPNVLGPGHSTQAYRPYPQFTDVQILSPTVGDSRYVGGFVRLSKRFTGGLNINTSYTRSTFLDNSFEGGAVLGADGGAYSNQYNRRADWGPSANDIRHRLTFGSVYDLPLGPGKRLLSNGRLGRVIGGWTIGAVIVAQSGPAFTVTTNTNNTNTFSAGNQRADVLHDPVLPVDQRTVRRWFDTTAFGQPAIYTFGNGGRDNMRGPGLINVDLSLMRNFTIREGIKLQLRGEGFNSLNHTNLSLPNAAFGNAAFGQINSSKSARTLQIGATLRF